MAEKDDDVRRFAERASRWSLVVVAATLVAVPLAVMTGIGSSVAPPRGPLPLAGDPPAVAPLTGASPPAPSTDPATPTMTAAQVAAALTGTDASLWRTAGESTSAGDVLTDANGDRWQRVSGPSRHGGEATVISSELRLLCQVQWDTDGPAMLFCARLDHAVAHSGSVESSGAVSVTGTFDGTFDDYLTR